MLLFLTKLRIGLHACGLQGKNVLLAVSGGPDSVAMLRGMSALCNEFQLQLQAAHLDHQLRDDSGDDARWLDDLARQLSVPLVIEQQDIAAQAQSTGRGIEETARDARYEFLARAAAERDCSHVAVAHTADDQAETILHHVLRGTGIAGLRGMPPSRPLNNDVQLVRPLLEISRQTIESFLSELGQPFRDDASNRDEQFTRNRIRHSLLPLLAADFNPQIKEALRRLGRQAGDVQECLDQLSEQLLHEAIEDDGDNVCRLNCAAFVDQPRHLIREAFKRLWQNLGWPRQKMGFAEWDRLAELASSEGTATFPSNIEARRRGNLLVLRRL